mgnify:CR=1 FL=1
MKIAGVQVRSGAIAYLIFEDLLIAGSILGVLAYSRGGSLGLTGSPIGTVNAIVLFLGIKATFFWFGLYDLRYKPTRKDFWRRLLMALAVVCVGTWLHWFVLTDERTAAKAFLLAFVSQIVVARLGFELSLIHI